MSLTAAELANAELDCATLEAVINGGPGDPDVISRLGQSIKPLAKAIAAVAAAGGYEPPVAYAAGLNILRATQTVTYLGNTYGADPADVPFVTGGVFNPAQWRLVITNGGLAIGLANAIPTRNIGADGNLFMVDGYSAVDDGGAGVIYRRMGGGDPVEPGEHTSADGVRLGLVRAQDIPIEAFGGIANDNSPAAKAANDAAIEASKTFDVVMEDGFYGTAHLLTWPGDTYYVGDVAGHDLKLTRRWKGSPSGGAALAGGHLRTQIIMPPGCKFLRVESFNTIGETTLGVATTSAAGSFFLDIDFVGNGGVEPSYSLNLIDNPTFDATTVNWTALNAGLAISAARMRVTKSGALSASAYQSIVTEVGRTYKVTSLNVAGTASSQQLRIGTAAGLGDLATTTGVGLQSATFTATGVNTFISLTVPSTAAAGSYADFDNVVIQSPNNAGYAIHPRTMIAAWNCRFRYHWDGIYNNSASGAGGADEGQASHCHYFQCSFEQNFRSGLWNEDAPDNNIQNYHQCNFIANARCGIYGGEFLGSNVSPSCHFRDNGARTDFFAVSSQCTYGGNRYYVNETATMATTDAALRVGNPTTNGLWSLEGAGGVHPNYPDFTTWVGTFQKGGPVVADRTTNAAWTGVGYYGEGAQPPFFWNTSCFIAPGLCGNRNVGYGTAIMQGRLITAQVTALGQSTASVNSGGASAAIAVPAMRFHNKTPLATFTYSQTAYAQGFNADGSPCDLGGWAFYSIGVNPATNYGQAVLFTREPGGALTERMLFDQGSDTGFRGLHPWNNGDTDLGYVGKAYRNIKITGALFVGGNQVVGARMLAVASPAGGATVDAQARTAIDAIRNVLSTHGLTA